MRSPHDSTTITPPLSIALISSFLSLSRISRTKRICFLPRTTLSPWVHPCCWASRTVASRIPRWLMRAQKCFVLATSNEVLVTQEWQLKMELSSRFKIVSTWHSFETLVRLAWFLASVLCYQQFYCFHVEGKRPLWRFVKLIYKSGLPMSLSSWLVLFQMKTESLGLANGIT